MEAARDVWLRGSRQSRSSVRPSVLDVSGRVLVQAWSRNRNHSWRYISDTSSEVSTVSSSCNTSEQRFLRVSAPIKRIEEASVHPRYCSATSF